MQYALVLKVDTTVVKNLFINCTYFTVDPFCNEKWLYKGMTSLADDSL